MMNIKSLQTVIAFAGILGLIGGCAHRYEAEADFGSSVREAIARHTVNPNGAGFDGVSPGLDGPAAKASVDRYIKSVEQPPTTGDTFKVGIGDANTDVGIVRIPSAK